MLEIALSPIPMPLSMLGSRIGQLHDGCTSPGVYLLCLKNKVIYIGESKNPARRLKHHIGTKTFDSGFIIRTPGMDDFERNQVEAALISIFKPLWNTKKLGDGRLLDLPRVLRRLGITDFDKFMETGGAKA